MLSSFFNKPIIRKVDAVGRISISPKLLNHLGLTEECSVIIYMENNKKVFLKKVEEACVHCGSHNVTIHPEDIEICPSCRQNQDHMSAIIDKRYEKQIIPNGRRLVIPFKIRHQLKINIGDKIIITPLENALEMEKINE